MPDYFLHGAEVVEVDDGLRPILTVKSSILGIVGTAPDADDATFPLNTPVLINGPRMAAALGADGTLADAYAATYEGGVNIAIVVRVPEGATAAETRSNIVGTPAAGTGIWALVNAQNLIGLTPRILSAPGFTSTPVAEPASPVTLALIAVAGRLRATVCADGPNTTEADALLDRLKYSSDRLMIVDPAVRVWSATANAHVTRPASAYAAAAMSLRDAQRGFWWSPSNQVLAGVAGTTRPVSWGISDPDTEANRLNEAGIATIVRTSAGGFTLWGNRSAGPDPLWAFISVRRTADMIYESIEAALLWAMDRPFSAQLLLDIRDSVQAYLDELFGRRAILGGRVWLDAERNTEATLKAGKLFLDFDFEPPAPLEHLTLQARRNGDYYEDLVLSVAGN